MHRLYYRGFDELSTLSTGQKACSVDKTYVYWVHKVDFAMHDVRILCNLSSIKIRFRANTNRLS